MHKYILLLHLLAATIWTGGHLILAITILPVALKKKSPEYLLNFEERYERIGIPSLILLVLTGLHMAYSMLPDFSLWFSFESHVQKHVTIKLMLLFTTILFALHARLRLIPNLTPKTLPLLASHIIGVTIISVLFVLAGLSFRFHFF
jgi:putative copper export protein